MADQGAIGYNQGGKASASLQGLASPINGVRVSSTTARMLSGLVLTDGTHKVVAGTTQLSIVAPTNYAVSGTVSVLGVATAGYIVRAYRRDNGAFLGQTVSGAGGTFSITIGGYNGEVTVLAYDDVSTAPDYNAKVFDRVVPV